jgi:hypothetical protein
MIGGTSKIPAVQQAIKKVFPNASRTMNPDETIATGSAYLLQQYLNLTQMKNVTIDNENQLFDINVSAGNDTIEVCLRGSPCLKEFPITSDFPTFKFSYGDISYTGEHLERTTQEFEIEPEENGTRTLVIAHPFQLKEIVNTTSRYLNPPLIKEMMALIALEPGARQQYVTRIYGDLEAYAQRILDEVANNATVRVFTNHTQRLEIIRCAERQKNWVKNLRISETIAPADIGAKMAELKMSISPVYRRIAENKTFWTHANKLYGMINGGMQWVEQMTEKEATSRHLFEFKRKVEKMALWFNETMQKVAEGDRCLPLPVRPRVLADKVVEFEHDMLALSEKAREAVSGPSVRRGDGSAPSDEELAALKKQPFWQKMQEAQQAAAKAAGKEEEL